MPYILNIETLKKDFKITTVIQQYFPDWKNGKKMCCPFHNEKTPSFHIHEAKNKAICYGGCGSFDPIAIIQEVDGVGFVEAVEKCAKLHKLNVLYDDKLTPEQKEQYKKKQNHKAALHQLNKKVLGLYLDFNYPAASPEGVSRKYLVEFPEERTFVNGEQERQLSRKTLEKFFICETPEYYQYLLEQSLSKVNLLELGLIREGKSGGYYDLFKSRQLFPIHDRHGNIAGFGGRQKEEGQGPKYLNSPESIIYKKRELLYGFYQQLSTIRKEKQLYIVEGYWDVLTLFDKGFLGAVACCGTAFTEIQAKVIKKYTQRVCFFTDNDSNKKENAGLKVVKRALPILLSQELFVELVIFPDEQDPDSFMREKGEEEFRQYVKDNRQDALVWWIKEEIKTRGNDAFVCAQIAEEAVEFIKYLKGHLADSYCQEVAKLLQLKLPIFRMLYNEARADLLEAGREFGDLELSKEQLNSLKLYGVYEEGSRIKNSKHEPISNFVIAPLFHLYSRENPKRLFKITNMQGLTYLVDTETQNLAKMESFMVLVESFGNYIYKGNKQDYACLKEMIYSLMGTANEVNTLGYHLDDFYTYGNGIFTKEKGFIPSNPNGIVQHKGIQYFLPASSELYKGDTTSFIEEKNFKHIKTSISFEQWAKLFCEVHGDKGKIALAFYLAALFRSSIIKHVKFPLLNLFGLPQTGKSFLAENIMALFYERPDHVGLNLHSCTQASFFNKLMSIRDGVFLLEEFKNFLHKYKIEGLKDAFDGLGRQIGQKNERKNKILPVLSACILVGQELPTADIALFSRVITLSFDKANYTQKQKEKALELKELRGTLPGITAELTTLRPLIEKHFLEQYKILSKDFQTHFESLCKSQDMAEALSSRMIENNVLLLTVVSILEKHIKIPFTTDQLFHICADNLLEQQKQFGTESEVATFWQIFEYLANDGDINLGDYKLGNDEGKQVLFMNFSRVYMKYVEALQKQNSGKSALNRTSLLHYLKNHHSYVGTKPSVRFLNKNTSAYVFNFKKLNISLPVSNIKILGDEYPEPKQEPEPTTKEIPLQQDLPFPDSGEFLEVGK